MVITTKPRFLIAGGFILVTALGLGLLAQTLPPQQVSSDAITLARYSNIPLRVAARYQEVGGGRLTECSNGSNRYYFINNGIDYGSSVRVIDSMGRQVYFATSGDFGPGGFIPGATEGEAPDIAGYDCHPVERQYGPPENTVELCSDKLDNDSDGNTDLADATCAPFRAMFPETGMEQCTDHRDNDNNGASDWQESACLQFFHENDALACGDKKDNDHDRREDAADPDCAAYYPLPANLLLEWHEGDVDFAIVNVRVEHVKRATEFTHLYFTLAIKNNSSHTTYAGPPGLTLFVGNTKSKLYLGDFGAVMPGERTYPTVSFALDDNLNSFELSTGGSTDIRFALSGNGGISVKNPPLQPPVVSAPTSTMQVVTSTTSSSTTP